MTNQMVLTILKKFAWVLLGIVITLTSLLGYFFYQKTVLLNAAVEQIFVLQQNQGVIMESLNPLLPEDKKIRTR